MVPIPLFFSWLTWNPHREVFRIPYINHPVMWYGLFFVTGFISGTTNDLPFQQLFQRKA